MGKLAVLLIDMQEPYPTKEYQDIIPKQAELIKVCQKEAIPVIMVEYIGCGRTIPQLTSLLPKDNLRVIKRKDDAFYLTPLDDILQELEVKKLILTGINACACVLKTAVSARELKYQITGSLDLMAGYGPTPKTWRRWYQKRKFFETHLDLLNSLT